MGVVNSRNYRVDSAYVQAVQSWQIAEKGLENKEENIGKIVTIMLIPRIQSVVTSQKTFHLTFEKRVGRTLTFSEVLYLTHKEADQVALLGKMQMCDTLTRLAMTTDLERFVLTRITRLIRGVNPEEAKIVTLLWGIWMVQVALQQLTNWVFKES